MDADGHGHYTDEEKELNSLHPQLWACCRNFKDNYPEGRVMDCEVTRLLRAHSEPSNCKRSVFILDFVFGGNLSSKELNHLPKVTVGKKQCQMRLSIKMSHHLTVLSQPKPTQSLSWTAPTASTLASLHLPMPPGSTPQQPAQPGRKKS